MAVLEAHSLKKTACRFAYIVSQPVVRRPPVVRDDVTGDPHANLN
jgi:hypothetical protein